MEDYKIWRDSTESDLFGEDWRPIKWDNNYSVSNLGRIKCNISCWNANGRHLWIGKIITQNKSGNGRNYLRVTLTAEGERKFFNVHRLVADSFIQNLHGKPQVNHKDGNPTNNRVDNLEWVTALENKKHAIDTGLQRYLKGEEKPDSKLKLREVFDIYERFYFKLESRHEIANIYNLHYAYIALLVTGKRWKEHYITFYMQNKDYLDKALILIKRRRSSNFESINRRLKCLMEN